MPTRVTIDKFNAIIDALHEGKSLKGAIKEQGISSQSFFDFAAANPSRADQYARAQRARAELLVEEVVEIADEENDAQRARNRIDARKWYASKMQPQKYGDRIDVNVHQTVDLTAALTEAKRRVIPSRYSESIADAELIETKLLQDETPTGSESVELLGEDADKNAFDEILK